VGDQRGKDIAEVVEHRLDDDERERRGFFGAERLGEVGGQRQRATDHARVPAVVIRQQRQHLLRERMRAQGLIGSGDIDAVLVSPKDAQLGVDHQDAVHIGRAAGAPEQVPDRHDVGGRDDLHHVGALGDALDPPPDGFEQRLELRTREAGFAVEPLPEPLFRQPAQFRRLALQPLAEADEGQAIGDGKRDGGRRKDGHDQARAERGEPLQGVTPGRARRPCSRAASSPSRLSHRR
jgi:hypothetical protein